MGLIQICSQSQFHTGKSHGISRSAEHGGRLPNHGRCSVLCFRTEIQRKFLGGCSLCQILKCRREIVVNYCSFLDISRSFLNEGNCVIISSLKRCPGRDRIGIFLRLCRINGSHQFLKLGHIITSHGYWHYLFHHDGIGIAAGHHGHLRRFFQSKGVLRCGIAVGRRLHISIGSSNHIATSSRGIIIRIEGIGRFGRAGKFSRVNRYMILSCRKIHQEGSAQHEIVNQRISSASVTAIGCAEHTVSRILTVKGQIRISLCQTDGSPSGSLVNQCGIISAVLCLLCIKICVQAVNLRNAFQIHAFQPIVQCAYQMLQITLHIHIAQYCLIVGHGSFQKRHAGLGIKRSVGHCFLCQSIRRVACRGIQKRHMVHISCGIQHCCHLIHQHCIVISRCAFRCVLRCLHLQGSHGICQDIPCRLIVIRNGDHIFADSDGVDISERLTLNALNHYLSILGKNHSGGHGAFIHCSALIFGVGICADENIIYIESCPV